MISSNFNPRERSRVTRHQMHCLENESIHLFRFLSHSHGMAVSISIPRRYKHHLPHDFLRARNCSKTLHSGEAKGTIGLGTKAVEAASSRGTGRRVTFHHGRRHHA